MTNVYIAGTGMTRIGRRSEPLQELMADAAHGALAEAGIEQPGMVVVADGSEDAAERLERVLTTDPGTGVIRHADAGYPEAAAAAAEHGIRIPTA